MENTKKYERRNSEPNSNFSFRDIRKCMQIL